MGTVRRPLCKVAEIGARSHTRIISSNGNANAALPSYSGRATYLCVPSFLRMGCVKLNKHLWKITKVYFANQRISNLSSLGSPMALSVGLMHINALHCDTPPFVFSDPRDSSSSC